MQYLRLGFPLAEINGSIVLSKKSENNAMIASSLERQWLQIVEYNFSLAQIVARNVTTEMKTFRQHLCIVVIQINVQAAIFK